MLALTLWRRFPYHAWRLIHRVMPALFLVLAFHAVALAPAGYWTGITGLLLVPLLAAGAWSAGVALAGRIGHGRRSHGRITALERKRDGVLEVECRLDAGWRGHQAGQFAFVRFDRREGRIRTPSPARPGRMAPSASKSRRWATTPRGFPARCAWASRWRSKDPTAASSSTPTRARRKSG